MQSRLDIFSGRFVVMQRAVRWRLKEGSHGNDNDDYERREEKKMSSEFISTNGWRCEEYLGQDFRMQL
jgi:hypothetical protein